MDFDGNVVRLKDAHAARAHHITMSSAASSEPRGGAEPWMP
jgi:hypothetical protein